MDQPPSRWKRKLAELEKEFESRELELKVLRDLDQRLLAEDGSLTDTCAFIARALSNLTELNQAEVLMRQRNVLEVVAAYPETTWSSPLGLRDSVCGWCALNAETVQIDDVLNNDKFSQLYKNFRDDQTIPMRSELAAPIKFGNVAVGVLNIENSRSRAFDTHDRDVLETLAGQASLAFKKLRLFNEAEVFAALRPHLLSDLPSADIAIQRVLTDALSQLKVFLGEIKHFQILFAEEGRLVVAYSSSGKDINVRIDIEDSVTGEAVRSKRAIVLADVTSHPKYVRMLGDSIRSEMAVPILVQGNVTGVLNFESEEPDYFDTFSSEIVQHFSAQMGWLLTLLNVRFELSARMRSDRASEILKALGDQTGNLIHRLNNVVGPIKLQAEEIRLHHGQTLQASPGLAEMVASMQQGAELALSLPGEMKRLFENVEFVDANSIILDVLEKFPKKKNVKIVTSLSDDLAKVRCQGLGAVIHTLVDNAVDSMPKGGTITVASSNVRFENLSEEFVEISVSDQGVGIARPNLDRIFDWDFTTKDQKQKSGLGWGLPWVKTFVQRVNGTIAVESAEELGSTFRIRFPTVTEANERHSS